MREKARLKALLRERFPVSLPPSLNHGVGLN